jgi:hypothetical protein
MSIQGISPKQTITNYKDSESTMIRKVIRSSWNNPYATGTVNGYKRAASEFKTIGNITDFLSRKNYACGNIPNPTQANNVAWRSRIGSIIKHCDDTQVPCSNANTKFVPDSSEYIKYKKQKAFNQNYNDVSSGGDQNNASYVAMRRNF